MPAQDDEASLVSTFFVEDALFGLHTLEVQEVILPAPVTPVHHAPAYISGIINLRGQIVTVVNLAIRLGLAEPADTPGAANTTAAPDAGNTVIVLWRGERVGLQVDRMAEVVTADLRHLEPAPANLGAFQQKYLRGLCRTPLGPAAVLDVDAVLDERDDETPSLGR